MGKRVVSGGSTRNPTREGTLQIWHTWDWTTAACTNAALPRRCPKASVCAVLAGACNAHSGRVVSVADDFAQSGRLFSCRVPCGNVDQSQSIFVCILSADCKTWRAWAVRSGVVTCVSSEKAWEFSWPWAKLAIATKRNPCTPTASDPASTDPPVRLHFYLSCSPCSCSRK